MADNGDVYFVLFLCALFVGPCIKQEAVHQAQDSVVQSAMDQGLGHWETDERGNRTKFIWELPKK